MNLKTGSMKAIPDRSVTDEAFKEFRSPRNGIINLGMLDATFLGKNERKKARKPGLIERTVTTEAAVNFTIICYLPREAVPPGSRATLPHGNLHSILADRRENILVPRSEVILGEKQIVITVSPTDQATVVQANLKLRFRKISGVEIITYQGMIFLLTRRQQSQRLISESSPIFLLKQAGHRLIQNAGGLATLVWSRRSDRSEHGQLNHNRLLFPLSKFRAFQLTPTNQLQLAAFLLRLCIYNRPAQGFAGISREWRSVDTQNHIALRQHSLRRTSGLDFGDQDLPRLMGHGIPADMHPAHRSGRPEVKFPDPLKVDFLPQVPHRPRQRTGNRRPHRGD